MQGQVQCAQCAKWYKTLRGLHHHQRHCQSAALFCAVCGLEYKSRRAVAAHVRQCRGSRGNDGAASHDDGNVEPDDEGDDDGNVVPDDEGDDNGGLGRVDVRPSIGAHMTVLDKQGSLDNEFVVRHRAPRAALSEEERAVIRFLRATETGGGCSRRQVESLLQHARSLGPQGKLLPRGYNKLWKVVDEAHMRVMAPLRIVEVDIPVPVAVQKVLLRPVDYLRFSHVDPTDALVRLLVAGPLAKDPDNLRFRPRSGGRHYDDFCDGERMARYVLRCSYSMQCTIHPV